MTDKKTLEITTDVLKVKIDSGIFNFKHPNLKFQLLLAELNLFNNDGEKVNINFKDLGLIAQIVEENFLSSENVSIDGKPLSKENLKDLPDSFTTKLFNGFVMAWLKGNQTDEPEEKKSS